MPNDVDKSLLDRLQALRGSSVTPERISPKISIDTIERAKTPTREDALTARLKSLRSQDSPSPSSTKQSPTVDRPSPRHASASAGSTTSEKKRSVPQDDGADDEAMFQTDDKTLEELLGDVGTEESLTETIEPGDDEVKALLEELSRSVPQDDATADKNEAEDKEHKEDKGDSDDSDGEHMTHEVDDVIARFRDEAEVDAALNKDEPEKPSGEEDDDEKQDQREPSDPALALPSVPSTLQDLPSTPSAPADLDDITARMAALRTSQSPSLALPSVPTSRPSAGKPVSRLTSKTNYTDDDMDGWCTVCLEDATLRCLGCDDDPYCARCWREMHVGPAAGFDERSHKAVFFTKDRKKKEKKVALGA